MPALDESITLSALLNAAGKAVASFASHRDWRREKDDLRGVAALVVADALARIDRSEAIGNAEGYVYRVVPRECWTYLTNMREWRLRDENPVSLFSEADTLARRAELFDELLACCEGDELNRQIITLREDCTLAEIAERLSISEATVSRRLSAIRRTFDERNF